MNENIKRKSIILVSMILLVILVMLVGNFSVNKTYAEKAIDESLLTKLNDMTEDLEIDFNNHSVNIKSYSAYLNDRFQLNNKNYDVQNIVDEWILKIVPVELFKLKKDYFYIGKAYGFYLNYDNISEKYLIYLILNEICYSQGLLIRVIKPLYYEQYVYNEETETVSLVYMDYEIYPDPEHYPTLKYHYYHYRKHSDYEKLYLKDVNFTGSLYNENHPNIDEVGYDKYKDNGGYFVESRYRFKGVSTQSGKFDFADAALQIGLGYIPLGTSGLTVGDVINVVTSINELVKFSNNAVNAFRGEISNEALYKNDRFLGMLRDEQIKKFGKPIKYSATQFQTNNTKDAVLLGINNDNYARNEWLINYYEQSNMWNTRFVGNVSLDIVKEVGTIDGSRVEEIAKDISPVTPCTYTINNGEETKINENEEDQLYILNDAKHRVSFTAPENGEYTIKTFGDIKNDLTAQSPQYGSASSIDNGINKSLNVKLKKGETIKLDVTKQPYSSSGYIGILIKFTPEEIVKGETKEFTLQPNDTVVFAYDSLSVDVLEYKIKSGHELELEIGRNTLYAGFYRANGVDLFGSLIIEGGKQYIKIRNNTDVAQFVTVSIEETEHLKTQEVNSFDVRYTKAFVVSLPYTMDVTLTWNSEKPMYMEIYNNENQLVAKSPDGQIRELNFKILSNQKYFVLVKQLFGTSLSASLTFKYNIGNLKPVYNYFNKVEKDSIFLYRNEEFAADFIIGTDLDFEIYDDQYVILRANADGSYTLNKNIGYYFQIKESGSQCNIDFNLVSTTNTSGVFPDSGVVYIKYTTSESGDYSVKGADFYFWLTENLEKRYGKLNANETYYLMLEGKAAEVYNINIEHVEVQRTQLPLTMGVERNAGQYYFIIEKQGNYTFKTFRNSDIVSSDLSIYDENGKEYCKNLCTDLNTLELTLSPGKYYLDLNVEPATDTVTIRINKKR